MSGSAVEAKPRTIRVPKSFWMKERQNGHRDWQFAFWRELFQNSVDAGSRNVSISVSEGDGKGSWGREPNEPRVVRVTFSDDGSGMTKDVLENVFFAPGETTKSGGGQVGGFGTARTMLCFSQSRYAIRTGPCSVEGDGSEYTVDDAEPVRGTTFEIDLSPSEAGVDGLLAALDRYIDMSQLPVRVTVNGEPREERTNKGPARRRLVAPVEEVNADGRKVTRERAFATVHANQGEKSRYRGWLIVRVSGATMFRERIDAPHQVVVEVDPEVSRQVLTSGRDQFRWTYQDALNSFMSELAQDKTSALRSKEEERHKVIEGGLGSLLVEEALKAPLAAVDYAPSAAAVEQEAALVPTTALRTFRPEDFEAKGFAGLPPFGLRELLERVRAGRPTFLDNWRDPEEVKAFREGAKGDLAAALGRLGDDFARFLAGGVGASLKGAGATLDYVDMHDFHFYKEGLERGSAASEADEATWKRVHEEWMPKRWKEGQSKGTSRGKAAQMLFVAWTTMCEHAVRALSEVRPGIGDVRFATGFAFVPERREWDYEAGSHRSVGTAGMHVKKGDVNVLLVNPLAADRSRAYDLSSEGGGPDGRKGLSDLAATAVHEVSHILRGRHDEEYARVLTQLMAAFYRPDRQEAMRADLARNLAAVQAAFGAGTSLVQAVEAGGVDPKDVAAGRLRPADRLRTLAHPALTAVAGTVADPSNAEAAQAETPALLDYIERLTLRDAQGVARVDCDAAAALDEGLARELAARAEPPAPLERPAEEAPPAPAGGGVSLDALDLGAVRAAPAPATPREQAPAPPGDEGSPADMLRELSLTRFSGGETRRVSAQPRPPQADDQAPAPAPAVGGTLQALLRSGALAGLAERIKATAQPIPAAELVEEEFDLDAGGPAP